MSINFNVALGEGHEANALITSMDLGLAKHEITRYRDEIETVLIESAELNVDSPETESKAVSFGTTAKKLAKRIDDLRKQIIDLSVEKGWHSASTRDRLTFSIDSIKDKLAITVLKHMLYEI